MPVKVNNADSILIAYGSANVAVRERCGIEGMCGNFEPAAKTTRMKLGRRLS